MRRRLALFLGGGIFMTSLMAAGAVVSGPSATTIASDVADGPAEDDLRSLSARFNDPQALQGWREFQVDGCVHAALSSRG